MSHPPSSSSTLHATDPTPSTSALQPTAMKTNAPAITPITLHFKIGTNHRKYLDTHDGKIFCHLPPQVITSPNAPTILRPFVYEDKPVQCCADSCYGYANIYQWPQMFCEEYPWGVMPTYANFVPLPDTTPVIGFISQEKHNDLRKVQEVVKNCYTMYKRSKVPECNPCNLGKQIMLIMRNNYNHLDRFPLTWCDIITAVTEFQCSAMECLAYFNHHQNILPSIQTPAFPYPNYNPYWMEVFTCNPGITETLFHTGISIWLIRHEDTVTSSTSLLAKVVPWEPDVVLAIQPGDTVSATKVRIKKVEARAFFADPLGGVPGMASTWAGGATVGFHRTTVHIASLTNPPLPLIHVILWELAQLSFHSDILALDKALVPQLWEAPTHQAQYSVIFSSEIIGGTWDTPLPQQHEGLF
ncbi:hypothetical protein BDN67DRAFT_1017479 [Paxillus ammoniavirescens]|nr:hypothetical protein BDN67DRAFT_1017479 [Paxillus ammoniavirescens]